MSRIDTTSEGGLTITKPAEAKPSTNRFKGLVQKNLLAQPASVKEAEHYFVQLNANSGVSKDQRDFLKIRSITKMIIALAKGKEGVDRNEVAQVLNGLRGKFKTPGEYLRALRKYLPKSFEKDLDMLESSHSVDSLYRSAEKF